ncbi:MAG: hypothetical protein AABY26_05775 [Nanoarchaeota archaeon]
MSEELKISPVEGNIGAIPEEKEDSGDTKSILITILILVGVFALVIAGFQFYNYFHSPEIVNVDDLHQKNIGGDLDEKEGYLYNGYSFVYVDGLWWTETNRFGTLVKIPLHYGAKDVENISVTGKLDSDFNQQPVVYIAINPNINFNGQYTLALSELNNNLAKGINTNIEAACTENNPICDNRTIVSCQNNSKNLPVVELVVEPQPKVVLSGTCIKVSGEGFELVKATDRLLLQWYGIMK